MVHSFKFMMHSCLKYFVMYKSFFLFSFYFNDVELEYEWECVVPRQRMFSNSLEKLKISFLSTSKNVV